MQKTKPWSIAVTTVNTVALPANPKRTALIISPPFGGTVSFGFGYPAVLFQGLTVSSNQPQFCLDLEYMGDDLQQVINVIGDSSGPMGVIEVFGP